MTTRPSIAKTAILLLPIQLLFRGGEAALPLLLAAWFGATRATDVLYLYAATFTFAGSLVSGAFQDSVVVPILKELRASDDSAIEAAASSLLGHAIAAATALAAVLALGAVAWAGNARPNLVPVAIGLAAAFAAHLVAMSVRSLFVALCNAHEKYTAHPIASGIGFGVALVVIAVARRSIGVVAVPLGLFTGELVAIAQLVVVTKRVTGISPRPTLARPEPVRRFFRLVVSDVGGATITRINPMIDQLVAATVGLAGGGTILRYAMEVSSLPTTLLQATVLPVLLTRLAESAASQSLDTFSRTVRSTLAGACAILVGLSALFVLARRPLLRIAFQHGEMEGDAIDAMADVLPWAVAGAAPFGALLVLARAHVALQNTRIMLAMGFFNAASNLVLDLVLVRVAGLRGIAFATSLVHLLVAVAFYVLLRMRLAERGLSRQ